MKRWAAFVLALGLGAAAAAQPGDQGVRDAILRTARQYLSVPYVYGAESPRAFDCSGFVRYVYAQAAGIGLPRSSRQMWLAGRPADLASAKTGDVLVFDTVGGSPSHVAILADKGTVIHAVSDGPKTGVIVSPLQDRYFGPRLMGARVFIAAGGAVAPQSVSTPPPAAPAPARQQPEATASPAVSTRSAPAAATPSTPPSPIGKELAVSIVGFTITTQPVIYTDKIPAQAGSALQYAVTNGTGRDGTFELLFYKMDLDPSKHKTLRQDRVAIKAGGMVEVEPFVFAEPGQYKLILKTHDNLKRVERIWRVVE